LTVDRPQLVSRVMVVLEGAPQPVTDEVSRQLQRASRRDSSLQLLLDALLELASLNQVSHEDIDAALATSASAPGIVLSMEVGAALVQLRAARTQPDRAPALACRCHAASLSLQLTNISQEVK
jgi:hypothetical protein